MKNSLLKLGILLMITMMVVPGITSCSKTNDADDQPMTAVSDDNSQAGVTKDGLVLSDEEALLFMREEEKLARDVYTYLYDKWELVVFNNITKSEQQHMDKVLELIVHFGLEDPALPGYGEFANQDLQELYNLLIEAGEASVEEALVVGATIEDLDIVDLRVNIEATEDELIACVFENLMRGSRNHLRAFNRHLEMRDIIYEPQYLTQEEFDAIINGPHEAPGTPCFF